MTEPGLTQVLADFVARRIELPDEAVRIAKSGFTDALATMIAGRDEPVVEIVRAFVRERHSSAAEASVLLGNERVASADAALINGTSAHALDYDDVALGGHPSTVLVPAVLAEGELLAVSGADAIRAYLVGYEVWAERAARDPDPYHEKGWHPTAVLGTVAAAAAVAHLHKLPAQGCRNAMALAASMASGLVANFGTMAKPLHAGRAAACGIDAVRMTRLGLTASHDAIEHHAGYLAALSPRGRANSARAASEIGKRLRILDAGLSIKRYPMCYSAHRTIDGLLDMIVANDIGADDVKEVRATIGPTQASMLRNHAPANALEAKFSLEFAAASALVARSVGLREFTDEFVGRAPVQRAMTKVRTLTVDTRCPIEPVFALADRVVLELHDGRLLDSGEIRFPRGNAKLPLRPEDLKAKFFDCVSGYDDNDAAGLYAMLVDLESLDSVRSLRRAR
jgi:2-methylcitrate dehydratase PrpD